MKLKETFSQEDIRMILPSKIAVREVREFLAATAYAKATAVRENAKDAEGMEVVFCCFSERDAAVYKRLLNMV